MIKETINELKKYTLGKKNTEKVEISVLQLNRVIKALEQEPCNDWYDVPSAEMTLEQARQAGKDLRKKLAEYLEQEPCEDAISREATLKPYNGLNDEDTISVWLIRKNIEQQPPVTPQPKAEQFAKWVAREIFDDEWEYNKDAFAEIACRKLAKLGIVRAKGDEWELVELEPCEDAISRQAVLKTLDDMDNVLDEDRTIENYKELLKECYEVLPPVTPQPKMGRWIHREDLDFLDENKVIHRHYMCQDCGFIHDFLDDHTTQYNYCPSCGLKMVEPHERSGKE